MNAPTRSSPAAAAPSAARPAVASRPAQAEPSAPQAARSTPQPERSNAAAQAADVAAAEAPVSRFADLLALDLPASDSAPAWARPAGAALPDAETGEPAPAADAVDAALAALADWFGFSAPAVKPAAAAQTKPGRRDEEATPADVALLPALALNSLPGAQPDLAAQQQLTGAVGEGRALAASLGTANPLLAVAHGAARAQSAEGLAGGVAIDPSAVALLASAPSAPAHEWAPLSLPKAAPGQWGQTLHEVLGERLQLQLGQGVEQARIRLDPPMLGSIDISIRHEGGALVVQLSASHAEVLRQLQQLGDTLRLQLAGSQYQSVSVLVADAGADSGGRSPGRQPQPAEAQPGRALAEADEAAASYQPL